MSGFRVAGRIFGSTSGTDSGGMKIIKERNNDATCVAGKGFWHSDSKSQVGRCD